MGATADNPHDCIAAAGVCLDLSSKKIEAQLERVLSSAAFTNSERMRRFLTFIVDQTVRGHGSQLKEYVIGVEAFDRGESFNPQTDSVVRGGARRLRSMLLDYYATKGRNDPVRIELPKGSYVPVFTIVQSGVDIRVGVKTQLGRWLRLNQRTLVLAAFFIALAGMAVVIAIGWPRGSFRTR